jgi:peptidoglycan/xylan/chitin deacetylase (PgdA/CDA1 family)
MAIMLVGYDIESPDDEVTTAFLRRAEALHTSLEVPATLFIRGQNLERNPAAFEAIAANPLFELQQHTYSHLRLKTLCQRNEDGVSLFRGGTLEEIRSDVAMASALLKEYLGIDCIGLTGPYTYYRGLSDRPDILQILWDLGIRYTRCFGRNEHDWMPVPLDWQPFWYEVQGFPEMLEMMTHGWHDCLLRPRCGWANLDSYVEAVRPLIDQAVARNLVFSYCAHDHSSIRQDPEMTIIGRLLEYAQAKEMYIISYKQYYEQRTTERLFSEPKTRVTEKELL